MRLQPGPPRYKSVEPNQVHRTGQQVAVVWSLEGSYFACIIYLIFIVK